MPQKSDISKVLVIGSGPIVIGQAAEFDYAGTQACTSLKELGLEVILVNSNPATIMTDRHVADKVYIEPLTVDSVAKIIATERPDGLLPTLGGQVGLNLAVDLAQAGILDQYKVSLLGTPLTSIQKAEDRELFKQTMQEIGEPIPPSAIVSTMDGALAFAQQNGYPVIIRPAFTLGGTGGGIAADETELRDIVERGLMYSPIHQILIEQSVAGWKEIEYEVMRDANDTCIVVCNMENFDPIGVHTGDSIVVAPSQTLADTEYQMLRTASLNIIRALGIEGGCNVQYALDTDSRQYYVIEVNPRVSRSSALASKATGYPIAKVAAKVAMGLHLDEIKNPVTGETFACFEPALDYVVVKIPRWPFDKFAAADRKLGTQMKSTGEVMSIGRSFEAALLKALRSLEAGRATLDPLTGLSDSELEHKLVEANDLRLPALFQALRLGWSIDKIAAISKIDLFFLAKLQNIIAMEQTIANAGQLTRELVVAAKRLEFSDQQIARLLSLTEQEVRTFRRQQQLYPVYKMVDTCAAEFEAATPYYYSCYEQEDEVRHDDGKKVIVLGSGPIRIGQGIEFDYCSVHAVWGLKELGYSPIIINNNPETVSTDFDTADRLYFEPLAAEDVLNIIDKEQPEGVVVQFGGQTAINLAGPLQREGVHILGTAVADIDAAEDRKKFDALLERLKIPRPQGKAVVSAADAVAAATAIGYPVVVRPSYVLGGRAMEIVYNEQELMEYMNNAVRVSPDHPVLVDQYLLGREVEVDAICDGEDILIPGVMEHIERAGVHSGDSMASFPPYSLTQQQIDMMVDYTRRMALALNVKGLVNVQYVLYHDHWYVLEVNPRSSRTVPFLSKITGVPMVQCAVMAMMGKKLKDMPYGVGLRPAPAYYAVKAPVFSFNKLTEVDTVLSPEMKSTGEVMGIDHDFHCAVYKAMIAAGLNVPHDGTLFASIADRDKPEALPILRKLNALGFQLLATANTAACLQDNGVEVTVLDDVQDISQTFRDGQVQAAVVTATRGKDKHRKGFQIRRAAVEYRVPCLTSLDTLRALCDVIERVGGIRNCECRDVVSYVQGN